MKRIKAIAGAFFMLLFMFGCNDYKTKVINAVNLDGSINRKVIITRTESGEFNQGSFQVPVDSTWTIEKSMEISEKNDTTWTLEAEKLFPSVEEINRAYQADTGANSLMKRSANFEKRYRWFNTFYRFSENVEGIMSHNYPLDDYLDSEELTHFYLPSDVRENMESGKDSLQYRALSDSIESKHEKWTMACLVKQWILDLNAICEERASYNYSLEDLQKHENKLIEFAEIGFDEDFFPDSLLGEVFGTEFLDEYKAEIDSAASLLEIPLEKYLDAEQYDMEIRMPGIVIGSNGYIVSLEDSVQTGGMQWTVSADYFFSGDYVMWVESRVRNVYAWVISGIFLLFVITGLIWRRRRKNAKV